MSESDPKQNGAAGHPASGEAAEQVCQAAAEAAAQAPTGAGSPDPQDFVSGVTGAGAVLDEGVGPDGQKLVLRRAAGGFEIVEDGKVTMRSAERRSERELINLGMVPLRDRTDITVLLAGLGMGYALAAILESPRVIRVDVVEAAAPIIEWNRGHLATLHREPPLGDSRVHVHHMNFTDYLRAMRHSAVPGLSLEGGGYLALIMDLDDGPGALSRARNADLYTDDGFADLEQALRPGGVIALWSGQREPGFLKDMNGRFQNLAEIAVVVDIPSNPSGLDYIYRARRRGPSGSGVKLTSNTRGQA